MKKIIFLIIALAIIQTAYAQCTGSHANPSYADATEGASVDVNPTTCASLAACNSQAWSDTTLTTTTPGSLSTVFSGDCTENLFSLTNTDILFETSIEGEEEDHLVRTVTDESNNRVFAVGNNNEGIILNSFGPQSVGVDPYLASFDMTTGAVNWQLEGSDGGDQFAVDIGYINGKVVALSNGAPGTDGNNVHVHNAATGAEICKVNIDNAGNDVELQALTVFDLAGSDKAYIVGKIDDGVNVAPLALRLDLTTCAIDWSKKMNDGTSAMFWDVEADSADNGIVAGHIDTAGDTQGILFVFTSAGTFQQILGADTGASTCDRFQHVQILPSGQYALGGQLCGAANLERASVCLATAGGITFDDCKKYNNNGDAGITELWSLNYDSTGDIYVSGQTASRTLMGSFSVNLGVMTEKWFAENALANGNSDVTYSVAVTNDNVFGGTRGDGGQAWVMLIRDPTTGALNDIDYFTTGGSDAYINHIDVSSTAAYAVGQGTKYIMAYEPMEIIPVPEFGEVALMLAALVALGGIFISRRRYA